MNFSRFASLLRNLLHKEREERELDEEVRSHEQLLVDENVRAGLCQQEARRQARLELGGVEQVRNESARYAPAICSKRLAAMFNTQRG